MEKLVTPPRRGTLPTWGPPPPCEKALKHVRYKKIRNLEILVFQGGRKPGYPQKNPRSENQQQTRPTGSIPAESNLGHTCGRRVLSPLSPLSTFSLLKWLLIFLYAKGEFSPHLSTGKRTAISYCQKVVCTTLSRRVKMQIRETKAPEKITATNQITRQNKLNL